jgi:hypothetical protein
MESVPPNVYDFLQCVHEQLWRSSSFVGVPQSLILGLSGLKEDPEAGPNIMRRGSSSFILINVPLTRLIDAVVNFFNDGLTILVDCFPRSMPFYYFMRSVWEQVLSNYFCRFISNHSLQKCSPLPLGLLTLVEESFIKLKVADGFLPLVIPTGSTPWNSKGFTLQGLGNDLGRFLDTLCDFTPFPVHADIRFSKLINEWLPNYFRTRVGFHSMLKALLSS